MTYDPRPLRICRECGENRVERRRDLKCNRCLLNNDARYFLARRAAQVRPLVARQVWEEAGGRCEYCGIVVRRRRHKYDQADDTAEIDHVTPAAMGGTGERSNLKLSCKKCNRRREAALRSVVRAHIEEEKRRTA